MPVSIIIPAHNAADTLAETLSSLLAQTDQCWEAIVVDDGSTDRTGSVASEFAARDSRIRLESQRQQGESGARNAGIGLARYEWLLFLDADDWLLPRCLERSTARLEADSKLDAALCGWTRVAPSGELNDDKHCPRPDDVFELSTRCCPFAIHACVVRRSLVEAAGRFDTTLRTCADWDLWQRIARLGARFGSIPEVLVRYRMRPDSAGVNGPQLLRDGSRVIEQGHSPDPRLRHPASEYSHGARRELLARAQYHFSCWAAGLMIGRGQDATGLLDAFVQQESDLDPQQIAWSLFESVLLPACRLPADWYQIWPAHEPLIERFLEALEARSLAPGIALRSRRVLERLALDRAPSRRPLIIGRTHVIAVEITEPIPNISPPAPADRLLCELKIEGKTLGSLELPVCDAFVPAYVLADAVAAGFAWRILGEFWRRTLYPQFQLKQEPDGASVWDEANCLARGLPEDEESLWQQAHNRIGWGIFSGQLWRIEAEPRRQSIDNPWFVAEATECLADVTVAGKSLICIPSVGGVPLGSVNMPVNEGLVPARQLRCALLEAVGFEPCRVAVREGLLGRPFQAPPASLWDRLRITAERVRQDGGRSRVPGIDKSSASSPERLFPVALSQALQPDESAIVLAPRWSDPIATSASRRAMLPVEAAPELFEAVSAGQEVFRLGSADSPPVRLVYAPDLMPETRHRLQAEIACSGDRLSLGSPLLLGVFGRLRRRRQIKHLDEGVVTDRLPILMYHRVAPEGDPRNSRYRITPESFREQLQYLHETGYASVCLEDWRLAMKDERPLPGRAVLLTFDDGYLDFQTYAWPLLRRYGFSAVLFVVTDEVGKTNRWDQSRGEELHLLGWKQLRRLQSQGIEVASHSASHAPLSALAPVDIVREGARSRAILERELGRPVRAFAYPYGIHDQAVQHLIGACGYILGLSCESRLGGFFDPLLALPRIEITGSDTLQDFVRKIGGRKV